MTKGEKLIWELFLMVRELMPATPDNAARQTEWARIFHELEHHDAVVKAPVAHDDIAEHGAPMLSQPAAERDIDEEDDGDGAPADPHEHGTPARGAGKRKKK